MDLGFFLLLPKGDVGGKQPTQKIGTWGGKEYPQEPKYYEFSSFTLYELPPYSRILDSIPEPYSSLEWLTLEMLGVDLRPYYTALTCNEPPWSDEMEQAQAQISAFESDLKLILNAAKLSVLAFMPEHERLGDTYLESVDSVVNRLHTELQRNDWFDRGFVSITRGQEPT